jgi:hypothetical protein
LGEVSSSVRTGETLLLRAELTLDIGQHDQLGIDDGDDTVL